MNFSMTTALKTTWIVPVAIPSRSGLISLQLGFKVKARFSVSVSDMTYFCHVECRPKTETQLIVISYWFSRLNAMPACKEVL